jgi:hypothetical protein
MSVAADLVIGRCMYFFFLVPLSLCFCLISSLLGRPGLGVNGISMFVAFDPAVRRCELLARLEKKEQIMMP